MAENIVESKGIAPFPESGQSLGKAVREELKELFDFRHPGPTLGRWAVLGVMAVVVTDFSQIVRH